MLNADSALVSSWQGEAIYYVTNDTFEVLYEGAALADIGYDSLRHRLLVPYFDDDSVAVYPLPDSVFQP